MSVSLSDNFVPIKLTLLEENMGESDGNFGKWKEGEEISFDQCRKKWQYGRWSSKESCILLFSFNLLLNLPPFWVDNNHHGREHKHSIEKSRD